MIEVTQTTFGVPGGNCFSACIASLLELSIDDVPYFMGDFSEPDDGEWFNRLNDWLRPRGFVALFFLYQSLADFPSLCVLGGASSRGPHSCVGRRGEIVWDPHPSRSGLTSVEDVTILVPLDPARRPNQERP